MSAAYHGLASEVRSTAAPHVDVHARPRDGSPPGRLLSLHPNSRAHFYREIH
jgi:hypothetical protein